ncbi:probable G-protein coupled receptor 139 [Scyliorhinus canicula]|uniref:probable G-protein coupled receptor 139 n=1 Tax=Scyliorhinus canicula TaxID=7830 RepID=UPI0018F29EEA|nr:probable G-protein coupled receptor 139 [Scyliorhinus canicula]
MFNVNDCNLDLACKALLQPSRLYTAHIGSTLPSENSNHKQIHRRKLECPVSSSHPLRKEIKQQSGAANLVTIVILSRQKCGLSKSVTLYLLAMAVSDLLVIVFFVIVDHLVFYYVKSLTFFPTTVCALNQVIKNSFMDCSVWSTVAFTFDRFVAICHQGFKARYCTLSTAATVLGTIWVVSTLRNIPEYFKYEPIRTISHEGRGCRNSQDFVNLIEWAIFDWVHHILTPFIPYIFIIIFNCLTVKHIVASSSARRRIRSRSNNANNDAEVANRRKSIILMFSISANFILLWMPNVIYFILDRMVDLHGNSADFTNPFGILRQTSTMLLLLSSCVNTFIYAISQTKFRNELKNGLFVPFIILIKIFNLLALSTAGKSPGPLKSR